MSTCEACGNHYGGHHDAGGEGLCPECQDGLCRYFRGQLDAGVPWSPVEPGSLPVLLEAYRQARDEARHLGEVLGAFGLEFDELGAGLDNGGGPLVLLGRVSLLTARRLACLLERPPDGGGTRNAA